MAEASGEASDLNGSCTTRPVDDVKGRMDGYISPVEFMSWFVLRLERNTFKKYDNGIFSGKKKTQGVLFLVSRYTLDFKKL